MAMFALIVIACCLAVPLSKLAMRKADAPRNGMEMELTGRQVIAPSRAGHPETNPLPAEPMWVAPW